MEDYSGLKAAIPASPTSGRLWGVPKKRKAEDRNPSEGGQKRENRDREDEESGAEETAPEEKPDEEEFRYGAHGVRRRKIHQVDVII
jgi:hypothetical protein